MNKKNKTNYLVTVIVRAYNLEKTIRQALDSVLSQKTDYPYEVIIGEDYSVDGTHVICQEYADKYDNVTLLANQTNVGGVANWIRCVKHSTAKYIMICDGDDYWHNPNKLQLQVDFMEQHPECVICHTDYDVLYNKTGKIKSNCHARSKVIPLEGMVQKEIYEGKVSIANVTSCYRRAMVEQYVPVDEYLQMKLLGDDYPTWIFLSAHGEVRYLPISTATYRVGQLSLVYNANYDKIRKRFEIDMNQDRWLREKFPCLGTANNEEYYKTMVYHSLLKAAYAHNDYASAREFRKHDPVPKWYRTMAGTWLTFQLARVLMYIK